jgi:phosphoserine phosphatase
MPEAATSRRDLLEGAVFDQDGTLWVDHPIDTQGVFALDRLKALAPQHPEWNSQAPYAALRAGDKDAIAKLSEQDWEQIVAETDAGMSVADFDKIAADWIATAIDPHFGHRYTELVYQSMSEVMTLFRANGFKTHIASGGGQGFIRSYADAVYGIPPEQVIGSTFATQYGYAADGAPTLTKEAKLQLNDNNGGKPDAINLIVGRRPVAAFGNSTGDQQMLEWTGGGDRAHLEMLALHDDPVREYAYGPANGLPDASVGTFTDALMTEATQKGWAVISMKRDWARVFPWSAAATPTAQ